MKSKKTSARRTAMPRESRFALSITRRFWLWLALWAACLLFTQALLSAASSVLFWFVSLLPAASLAYLLLSRAALKLLVPERKSEIEKHQPLKYELQLINESVLPYPFVDAVMRLPTAHSVRCVDRCVRLSMPPSTVYGVKDTVRFKFRGTYSIGVSRLYVYDLFRLFRLRIDVNSYGTVSVLPRRLPLRDEQADTGADSARSTLRAPASPERLEVADVREYRDGDTQKSVHWKLSARSEELIVRDYNAGVNDSTFIIADMSAHFPNTPPARKFVSPYAAEEEREAQKKAHARLLNKAASTKNPIKSAELKRRAAALLDAPSAVPEPDVNAPACDEYYADMNEYCADGVVEATVALTLRELRRGRAVRLVWFDERADIGVYSFLLRAESDLDMIFRLFASAPIAPPECSVRRLVATLGEEEITKLVFVLPTLNDATVSAVCAAARSAEGTEAVHIRAEERYAERERRRAYVAACAAQLAEAGETLTDAESMMIKKTGGEKNE